MSVKLTRAQGKFCTNPWYPKKPYINVQGCWYEKDTGDGFLDGEAPACDLQGSWQGGWWDSSAPAPLAENGQPEATCALVSGLPQTLNSCSPLIAMCPVAWRLQGGWPLSRAHRSLATAIGHVHLVRCLMACSVSASTSWPALSNKHNAGLLI